MFFTYKSLQARPKFYVSKDLQRWVIACTLLVTSCECERSVGTLRRLRNFMRAGMRENSLTSLMHVHYEKEVNLDMVVDLFAKLYTPKKITAK